MSVKSKYPRNDFATALKENETATGSIPDGYTNISSIKIKLRKKD